jgi:uncharacterized protein YcnI
MTKHLIIRAAAVTMIGLGVVAPASAHITLAVKEAHVGASYTATFKVPHGCAGTATTAIRVQIPLGVFDVKPMAKAGWRLDLETGPYDQAFADGGRQFSDGVIEVSWIGGHLADQTPDEFTFVASLADTLRPGTPLYFPVVQECEGGAVERWIEIPASGKTAEDYKTPAPSVALMRE